MNLFCKQKFERKKNTQQFLVVCFEFVLLRFDRMKFKVASQRKALIESVLWYTNESEKKMWVFFFNSNITQTYAET
jgi:hypothetical protein